MAMQILRHPEAFTKDSRTRQKQPRKKDDSHLRWLRGLPCLVTGAYGVEAAHIRYGDDLYHKRPAGGGEKPSDMWAIPLSPAEHRRQHSMNEQSYWQAVGIDPLAVALQLWAHSGNDETGEKIIALARGKAQP